MDDNNKNLILATALSFIVILVWFVLFPPPEPVQDPNLTEATAESLTAPIAPTSAATAAQSTTAEPTDEAIDAPRVQVETARVSGSISLQGGRIDDLSLKGYRETLAEDSDIVHLLKPRSEAGSYYALYGWTPGAGLTADAVPGVNTIWSVESGDTLTETNPVTLAWDNGAGLTFRREMSIDENYMFSVKQSVENTGAGSVSLAPYGILARHGEPADLKNFFILHEGAIRQRDDERDFFDYGDIQDFEGDNAWSGGSTVADVSSVSDGGWLGFTDHYWMTMLIPAEGAANDSVLQYNSATDTYRATIRLETQQVSDGETKSAESRLFAGAKEWETIRNYQNKGGVANFLDSIDWGWFFFLTKPIFALLHFINGFIGNMGWAIIGLTIIIKIAVFPLAYKSYSSMAKMKELQPEMEKLKEKAGDDRQKMQQEMMALYKKEKVNPASGCLPLLIQIPIFFSLYKVIFVTLELRHAPWFGWITDLSAPDPSSILNLFGLLPYAVPELGVFAFLSLGILPILLGVSMWLQQKLNPAPTDPAQAMIFAWMPWVFMFMLGTFASGLVVYWIANNTITFTQQYLIMRRHGYKPDVFGNIVSSFKRKEKTADK